MSPLETLGMDGVLADASSALGCPLDAGTRMQLIGYLDLIAKWNRVYNLTAVRDRDEMLTHHVLDSLSLVPSLRRHTQGRALRLLDVGSGGGLPGVVLALCMPELSVTCVDAVAKKASFVRQVAAELGIDNLRGEHSRVENLHERFDVVTSRAFASLADFVRLTVDRLAPNGVWVAMKGKLPRAEMDCLPPEVKVFHVEHVLVPGLPADRCLVWMRRAAEASADAGSCDSL